MKKIKKTIAWLKVAYIFYREHKIHPFALFQVGILRTIQVLDIKLSDQLKNEIKFEY